MGHLKCSANLRAWFLGWGMLAHQQREDPLSETEFLYRCLVIGDRVRYSTLAPPALIPKMVTCSGSPPKDLMWSWTHCRAMTWSKDP